MKKPLSILFALSLFFNFLLVDASNPDEKGKKDQKGQVVKKAKDHLPEGEVFFKNKNHKMCFKSIVSC